MMVEKGVLMVVHQKSTKSYVGWRHKEDVGDIK